MWMVQNKNRDLRQNQWEWKAIIFDHLPNTGGFSLMKTVSDSCQMTVVVQYFAHNDQFEPMTQYSTEAKRLFLCGHNLHGVHEDIGNYGLPDQLFCNPIYITLLREPIDRLISEFFWQQGANGHSDPGKMLDEFCRFIDELSDGNYYCRYWSQPRRAPSCLGIVDIAHEASKMPLNEAFCAAQKTLSAMRFVGIMEMFEETLFSLFENIGIGQIVSYYKGAPAMFRPGRDQIPFHTMQKLRKITEADRVLYDTYSAQLSESFAGADFGDSYYQYKKNSYVRLLSSSDILPRSHQVLGFETEL